MFEAAPEPAKEADESSGMECVRRSTRAGVKLFFLTALLTVVFALALAFGVAPYAFALCAEAADPKLNPPKPPGPIVAADPDAPPEAKALGVYEAFDAFSVVVAE